MAELAADRPCPCGSGKVYTHCCGAERPVAAAGADVARGLAYLTGRGAAADPARGAALIERAAEAGDAEGAWLAATLAASGLWRRRNWGQALDFLAHAAALGHGAARSSLRILARGPDPGGSREGDWDRLRQAVDIDAWLLPPALTRISDTPRIESIPAFAPPAACDWLIAQARDRLSRATIYDRVTGGSTEDERRTNSQCDLDVGQLGVLTFVLRARIAAITGRPERAMEIPKVLHYSPGETFAAHFDYLDPQEPAYAAELAARGQRILTFLIYLNDGFGGGETAFPLIDVAHKGAKGDALLFANVDAAGNPDEDTMHAGMPPTSGEKWIFSQWIRERPGR